MGKLPWFPFYPADWLSDGVAGCSLAARGLWIHLLCIMHLGPNYGYLSDTKGQPISPDSLARRCGCTFEEFNTLLAELEAAGVPSRKPEGVIFSRRMVRDAEKRAGDAQRQQKHRSRGASHAPVTPLSRSCHRDLQKSESDKRKHSSADADVRASSTTKQTPGFDDFYRAYPKKRGREDAARAWRKVRPEDVSAILAAVEGFKASEDWQRENGRYVPYPATFLNGRRWEDQVSEPSTEEIPFVEPYR